MKSKLPRNILVALGLAAAGCKKSVPVHPCLKIAVEPEPDPDPPEPDSGSDDPEDPEDPDTGPCLDIGPCLKIAAPKESTNAEKPAPRTTPAPRADVLRALIEEGVLPPDVGDRLSGSDS